MIYIQKIRKLFHIIVLSVGLCMPFASMNASGAQDTSPLVIEAETVINQYFTALINGEINTIRTLLGPDFLKHRARLLSNPVYSAKLREIYQNAVFAVTGYQVINFVTVAINVEVTYSTAEKSRFRFVLKKSGQSGMRIFSESEIL